MSDLPDSIREAQARLEQARANRPKRQASRKAAPRPLAERLAEVIPLPTAAAAPLAFDDSPRIEALARAQARAIADAGFPLADGDVRRVTAGELSETQALRFVRGWSAACDSNDAARRVLVLLGPPGTGKTMAAATLGSGHAWDDRAYGNGWRGTWTELRYVKVRDLCRLYRSEWGPEREAYEAVLRAPVVVVDELGTGADEELERRAVHDIVDERQSQGRTLLIGNLSKAEFLGGWTDHTPRDGRYDARTYDRLRAIGALREVTGQSLRRGKL